MTDEARLVSDAFRLFMKESPGQARAWMGAVRELGDASAHRPQDRQPADQEEVDRRADEEHLRVVGLHAT